MSPALSRLLGLGGSAAVSLDALWTSPVEPTILERKHIRVRRPVFVQRLVLTYLFWKLPAGGDRHVERKPVKEGHMLTIANRYPCNLARSWDRVEG